MSESAAETCGRSHAWIGLLVALACACRQNSVQNESKSQPRVVMPTKEPAARVGRVFRQHEVPPPTSWRVSSSGERIVAPVGSGCGVWTIKSSWNWGTVTNSDDSACSQWPALVPLSTTRLPFSLAEDAIPGDANIQRLWSEPQRRWFVVEYKRAHGNGEGGFVVTPEGRLSGLLWGHVAPEIERVSATWYDEPSPLWLEVSLVANPSWAGYTMRIDPVNREIDEFQLFDESEDKPKAFQVEDPNYDGRPAITMRRCRRTEDDGEIKCIHNEAIPVNCEAIGGWIDYWILACQDSQLSLSVGNFEEPRPLPGASRDEVKWVAAKRRLAWWSQPSGLTIYDSEELDSVVELPQIQELQRATLDSELGRALVRTGGALAVLDLETAKLGPARSDLGPLLSAAFAPDGDSLAMSDGELIRVWQLSTNEIRSWPAAHIVKLAWRQDSKVLLGASTNYRPERGWDPKTGEDLAPFAPELDVRLESHPAQFDPTWRWVIIGEPRSKLVDYVEVVRLLDGQSLYVSSGGELNGGAVTSSGLYESKSAEWFLDIWRVGFGSTPLTNGWRVDRLTNYPENGRVKLVEAFFAGEPLTQPSW